MPSWRIVLDQRSAAVSRLAVERFQRLTPREKTMLLGLGIVALLVAPLPVLNWRDAQEEAYVQALSDRVQARADMSARRRVEASAADTAIVEDMRSWGFEATNVAVARVLLEQRATEAATEAGLSNVRVEVGEEAEAVGPTRWVDVTVRGDLRWGPVFRFLDLVSAWPEGFTVKGFGYDPVNERRNPPTPGQMELVISAPVELIAAAGGNTSVGPAT